MEASGILVYDDEEWNISKLREKIGAFRCDYVCSFDDFMSLLLENTYQAIIVDFNMDFLNGKQVIAFLKGQYDKAAVEQKMTLDEIKEYDQEIADVIDEYFTDMDEYRTWIQKFENTIFVLFSSTLYGDGRYEPILNGVYVLTKNNEDLSDYSAEQEIKVYLEGNGIL